MVPLCVIPFILIKYRCAKGGVVVVGTGFKAAVEISLRRLRRIWMQMGNAIFVNGFDRVADPEAAHPV